MAWHLSVSDVSENHIYGQNHVDRTAVMFRKDEFRTPSPQLLSWHSVQTFDSTAMDDDSNDDFYFRSSENVGSDLQLPNVKFVNHGSDIGSLNGNRVIPLEALDGRHLRCITPELPSSCSIGSGSVRTDRTQDGRSCIGSQVSQSRRLIVDRRSMWNLHYVHFTVILFLWGPL